jgi:hypothetical protein
MHFPEVGYESSWTWQTIGVTRKLLSLEAESYTFTGGAHPNPAMMALLWDRSKSREIGVNQLFQRARDYAALRSAYCKGLDAERRKKRGGEGKLGSLSEFDQCPKFSELVVGIVDDDGNSLFDALRFTANPYVAGPYVEGMYVVDLPITRALIAELKPEYRSTFEIQRQ